MKGVSDPGRQEREGARHCSWSIGTYPFGVHLPTDTDTDRGQRSSGNSELRPGHPRRVPSRRIAAIALSLAAVTAVLSLAVAQGSRQPVADHPHGIPSTPKNQPHDSQPVHPAPGILGFYAGYENQAGVRAIASELKAPVSQAMDFFDGSTWSTIVGSPANVVPAWTAAGYQMTWSIPMLPDARSSLLQGATGAYDKYFASMAEYLVAHGQASSIIRLGWEFNGYWFSWSADSCQSCFVSYWRQIVDTMRSVPGAEFRFEWTPAAGLMPFPIAAAYPGNAWVDIVGLDVYDEVYHDKAGPTRWHDLLVENLGLDWLASFASSHHKPIAFPEWGLGFPPAGGGDNPYYITHMADYIATHDVVSAIYWDYGTSKLDRAPHSLRAFVAAFG